MAESDYRRLGCTVEGCAGAHKAKGLCLRHYRQDQRGGVRQDATHCVHCREPLGAVTAGTLYCGNRCKLAAWKAANRERYKAMPANQPKLCAYLAKPCDGCGKAWGARRAWNVCPECIDARQRHAASIAAKAMGEARHRAAGRVVQCDECGAAYCPLYGAKPSAIPLCSPCAALRRRRAAAGAGSNVQRAKRARVRYRYFDERRVLERDGWTCQLCGIPTPKEARGSIRPDAPEFDHCLPLALGGPHLPENGQCLCRTCNGAKADSWCDRSVAAAVARGLRLPTRPSRRVQERPARWAPPMVNPPGFAAPADA